MTVQDPTASNNFDLWPANASLGGIILVEGFPTQNLQNSSKRHTKKAAVNSKGHGGSEGYI